MSVETLRDAWSRRHPDFDEIFQEGTSAIAEEVRKSMVRRHFQVE